jgi:hypothetical protein
MIAQVIFKVVKGGQLQAQPANFKESMRSIM